MKSLWAIVRIVLAQDRWAFFRGFLLAVVVLAMGLSLLSLSGWFITAAAAAGLAGLGALFNVFVPSALVRFLALGRTAARYGERLLTHDATLRALSALRVRLLRGVLGRPWRHLERLRAAAFLNRVTADIDALDGVLLRLVIPGFAGLTIVAFGVIAVWIIVHPSVAMVIALGYGVLPTLIFLAGQRRAGRHSRGAEAALQAGRSRLIDLIATREDLAVYGQLNSMRDHVATAFARLTDSRRVLDGIERRTAMGLDLLSAGVTPAALGIGAELARSGEIDAARAAVGVFAALALAEAVAPVRRALSEIGRIAQAARRVVPSLAIGPDSEPALSKDITTDIALELKGLTFAYQGGPALFAPLSMRVEPGETVALTGPSGCGKSTVLLLAAGMIAPTAGDAFLNGRPSRAVPEEERMRRVAMVPQRHALIAGTIAENLRLADAEADEEALWQTLEIVSLAQTVRERGGLDFRLGFRGAGLSGGESRRLVLARALLRNPALLLLDEPTEGLDEETATRVMGAIRMALPHAAILLAAHRGLETALADRVLRLDRRRDITPH